jgi:hypothetical protein
LLGPALLGWFFLLEFPGTFVLTFSFPWAISRRLGEGLLQLKWNLKNELLRNPGNYTSAAVVPVFISLFQTLISYCVSRF